MKDRFIRVMLVLIAVLLGLNLAKSGVSLVAPAQAATSTGTSIVDVQPVKGYEVVGLQNVVSVGDGRTFVVSAPGKFMVYQVVTR
jgi:hypothetical protein